MHLSVASHLEESPMTCQMEKWVSSEKVDQLPTYRLHLGHGESLFGMAVTCAGIHPNRPRFCIKMII